MHPVLDFFCALVLLLSFRRGYYQGLAKAWRQIWQLFVSLGFAWQVRMPAGNFLLPYLEFEIPIPLAEVLGFLAAFFLSGLLLLCVTWYFRSPEEVPAEELPRTNRFLGGKLQVMKVCIFLVPSLLLSEVSMTFVDPSLFSQLGPFTSSCAHRIGLEVPIAELRILEKGRFIVGAIQSVGSEQEKMLALVVHPELLPVWNHPYVEELLQDPEFQQLQAKNQTLEMLNHPKFIQSIQSAELREIVARMDWEQLYLDIQSKSTIPMPIAD